MALRYGIPIFCMLFALLTGGISAAHSAPAPAVDCSALVLSMADCLSYVTAGGTAKKPEGNCCSGLKTVLKTDADCLCESFKNSAQLGITLNITKAMTLPAACHVSSPSLSNCALSTSPSSAPAVSPMAALSPSSGAGAPTTGIGGSEGAPAPSLGSGSGSSALGSSIELVVFSAVAAVSFALF